MRWTVWRLWRGVEAETATEALRATQPGEHDEVKVIAQHEGFNALAPLYFTAQEMGDLVAMSAAGIGQLEQSLAAAQAPEIRAALQEMWTRLNSLRTAITEARWSLLPREQVDREVADMQEAANAGLITGWTPPRRYRDE